MVSLSQLKAAGITAEKLKSLFTSEKPSDEIERVKFRVRTRIQDGTLNNFQNYKYYWALDQAWDTPFKQVNPTLLQSLANMQPNDDVFKIAKEWGYTMWIVDDVDEKTGKPTGRKKFNLPSFYNVFVPIVRAYVTIRAAKLTGDRDLIPYFKFEPVQNTPINRARCEVLTDRMESMTTQLGYRDVGRQAILKMLIYGVQLQFIQEEWWTEEQKGQNGKTRLIREGLRYHLPHPTRTFWDMAHPLSSINTDCGCQFAGYWRVRRFKDVRENMQLWNTDKIAHNATDLRREHSMFFNAVYGTCTLQFPQSTTKWAELDRETQMSTGRFYTSDFDDSAVVITEYFEKLNPKEDGIGDYDYPVWFRFVCGGDGTILYAAPLPSVPIIVWNYDPDESRMMNPSLALECLPFQDQISNLLTQALLSVKQNLANVTFVDSDIVDETSLNKIENMGERFFRRLNFLRFSGRAKRAAQQDVRNAFGSVRFPQLDVTGCINMMNAVITMLERVLVMSSMEVAGQATHEQSAEEITGIKQQTSVRVNYTSMCNDRSYDAWKVQLYNFNSEYGEAESYAYLSPRPEYTQEMLDKLGFTVEEPAGGHDSKVKVSYSKDAIQLEYFASTREGSSRLNNAEMAQAMVQALNMAMSNPMIAQSIGPVQSIMLMNEVLEQLGVPKDFKLRPVPPQMPPDQMQQWVQQQMEQLAKQLQQLVQQGGEQIMKSVGEVIKPLAAATKEALAMGQQNQAALTKIIPMLSQLAPPMPNDNPNNGYPVIPAGGPGLPPMAQPAGVPVAA